eukprot:gb/GECH01007090.1/.p1 GENE.gb/GECH01007090.1/~~gb/GECH01007090.1/.p1  ORF type:complete len:351 (+),score=41.33 gb/GECH01007090.1/:1-1053(+)
MDSQQHVNSHRKTDIRPVYLCKQYFSQDSPGKFKRLDSIAENILDFDTKDTKPLPEEHKHQSVRLLVPTPNYFRCYITGVSVFPYVMLHCSLEQSPLRVLKDMGMVSPSMTDTHPVLAAPLSWPLRVSVNTGFRTEIKTRWSIARMAQLRTAFASPPGSQPTRYKVSIQGDAGQHAGMTLGMANGVAAHTLIGRIFRDRNAWLDAGYEVFWSPSKGSGNVSAGARGFMEHEGVQYILATYGSVLGNFTTTYTARALASGMEAAARYRYNYTTQDSSFAAGLGLWRGNGGFQLRYDTNKGIGAGLSIGMGHRAVFRGKISAPTMLPENKGTGKGGMTDIDRIQWGVEISIM